MCSGLVEVRGSALCTPAFTLPPQAFNVLKYENNQHYDSHYDSFNPKEFGPQPSQRIATVLVYLWVATGAAGVEQGQGRRRLLRRHAPVAVCRDVPRALAAGRTWRLAGRRCSRRRATRVGAKGPGPLGCMMARWTCGRRVQAVGQPDGTTKYSH